MVNLLILIVPLVFSMATGKLEVAYEWKYIDYLWENSIQKQEAIDSGNYNATQIFPIDVDRTKDGRIFVTTPRQPGVPASLSTVSDKLGEGGPLLNPYPDWSWHQKTDCTGIISVYRVRIDRCQRLWVLDSGKNGEELQVCPAQLLAFNLLNNELVKKVTIPLKYSTNATGKGLLITPVVETYGRHCERTDVYMADTGGYGLVVYNGRYLRRFTDPSFSPENDHLDYTVAGESFRLTDGLFSLALKPERATKIKHEYTSTRLYYRPLGSLKQYAVSTRDLIEESHRTGRPKYQKFNYTFPSQVTTQDFTQDGILIMAYTNPPAIACWNTNKVMKNKNVVIIAQDDETLQFASGLKVKDFQLLVLTNRLQKIMTGSQSLKEINYRILIEPNIYHLIRDTTCAR